VEKIQNRHQKKGVQAPPGGSPITEPDHKTAAPHHAREAFAETGHQRLEQLRDSRDECRDADPSRMADPMPEREDAKRRGEGFASRLGQTGPFGKKHNRKALRPIADRVRHIKTDEQGRRWPARLPTREQKPRMAAKAGVSTHGADREKNS